MVHRSNRVAGAFNNDINRRMRHQGKPVFADMGVARLDGRIQRRGLHALRLPAHSAEIGSHTIGRKIGNPGQMHTGRAGNLSQIHRAELARTDQSDADRASLSLTLLQFGKQTHAAAFCSSKGTGEVCSALPGRPSFQGSSTG